MSLALLLLSLKASLVTFVPSVIFKTIDGVKNIYCILNYKLRMATAMQLSICLHPSAN